MAATDEPRSGARAVDRAIAIPNCFDGDDPELSVSDHRGSSRSAPPVRAFPEKATR